MVGWYLIGKFYVDYSIWNNAQQFLMWHCVFSQSEVNTHNKVAVDINWSTVSWCRKTKIRALPAEIHAGLCIKKTCWNLTLPNHLRYHPSDMHPSSYPLTIWDAKGKAIMIMQFAMCYRASGSFLLMAFHPRTDLKKTITIKNDFFGPVDFAESAEASMKTGSGTILFIQWCRWPPHP